MFRPHDGAVEAQRRKFAGAKAGIDAPPIGRHGGRGVAALVGDFRRLRRRARQVFDRALPEQLAGVGIETEHRTLGGVAAGKEDAVFPHDRRAETRRGHGDFPEDAVAALGVPFHRRVRLRSDTAAVVAAETRPVGLHLVEGGQVGGWGLVGGWRAEELVEFARMRGESGVRVHRDGEAGHGHHDAGREHGPACLRGSGTGVGLDGVGRAFWRPARLALAGESAGGENEDAGAEQREPRTGVVEADMAEVLLAQLQVERADLFLELVILGCGEQLRSERVELR